MKQKNEKQRADGAGAEERERDRAIAETLCAWFEKSARDLPWRQKKRDPYAVWLSEVMLQQTRVDTVVPYFERFLKRFPDARSLAQASLDEVLHLWSGLGYYRRARELHAAAGEVVRRYGGALPEEASELRTLPGIGPYTAGAIASMAFGKVEPLVDGNVSRVLARLFGVDEDIRSSAGSKKMWSIAARLVPKDKPGQFNEALMEFGATVCTPKDPHCLLCPARHLCSAFEEGKQLELPVVGEKASVPRVLMISFVLWHGADVLFARRSEGGLFGGMWEPPMIAAASLEDALSGLRDLGIELGHHPFEEVGEVRHLLTHRELFVKVAAARANERFESVELNKNPYERMSWLSPGALKGGVSTLALKVLEAGKRPGLKAKESASAKKRLRS